MKKMIKFIPLAIAPALVLVACANANGVSTSENGVVTDNAITTVKVTVDFDGGTVGGLPSKQYSVRKGTLYEYYKTKLPKAEDITYADHTFKYYSSTRNGTELSNTFQFNGDITIFAVYDSVKPETTYSVTWKNHGGTTLLEETDQYHVSETPTYKGADPVIDDPTPGITYEFDGWNPEPTPFVEGDPARTYTAKYKEVTSSYTVSFDTHGGSSIAAQQVSKGGKVSKPATDPTKTGYDFDGWWTLETGGTAWNFDTDTISSNTTIHAHWKDGSNIHTITFHHQDGDPETTTEGTVRNGERLAAPDVPTYSGHKFDGWFTAAEEGEAFNFETIFNAETLPNNALYAHWTKDTVYYTVSFNSQGGTSVDAQTIAENGKVNEPADPSKEGSVFGGWYKEAACENEWKFDTDTVTANTVLYAKWTVNKFDITFDPNGGTWSGGGTSSKTISFEYGKVPSVSETLSKDGATFTGWSPAIDIVTENKTYTAQWKDDPTPTEKVTVTFDSQGGDTKAAQTIDKGGKVSNPGDSTKAGSTFGGWYKEAACENEWKFDTDTVNTNITLYAKWTVNKFDITFKANGGTWSGGGSDDKTISHEYNAMPNPGETLTKSGATFIGWDPNLAPVTGVATYTAQWKDDPTPTEKFTVTFDTQGGTSVAAQTIDKGGYVTNPGEGATSKTGSVFGGWYKEAECTNAWVFTTDTVTKDTTLYAKWTVNTFSVTFKPNGGTWVTGGDTGDKTVTDINYGDMPSPGDTLVRSGYIFTGWSPEIKPVTAAGDVYTAQWAEAPKTFYTVTFDSQGGSAVASQSIVSGGLVAEPKSPTKTDKEFAGWYKNDACTTGQEWNFASDTVTATTTLYAKWTDPVIKYHIRWMNPDMTELAHKDVDPGDIPTYSGPTPTMGPDVNHRYVFAGWSPIIYPADSDMTYFATYDYDDEINFSYTSDLVPLSGQLSFESVETYGGNIVYSFGASDNPEQTAKDIKELMKVSIDGGPAIEITDPSLNGEIVVAATKNEVILTINVSVSSQSMLKTAHSIHVEVL